MEKGVPCTTGSITHMGEGTIGITDSEWESGIASDMMMEGPRGEDTEKYSDKGRSLDCSDQDERKLSEASRGDVRQTWDRQTDRYSSVNCDRESVYGSIVHVDTLEFVSTGVCLEILFWGGNMVDKEALLCTVGAFATSQL